MSSPERRRLLSLAACAALAGCAGLDRLNLMGETLALVGKGKGEGYPRTRAEIDALPYAQIGVSRGSGSRAVLVLADVNAEELSWVSADRVQIVTCRNRVIRTTGLHSDIGGTEPQGPDLWDLYDPAERRAGPGEFRRSIRVEPGRHPTALLRSRFEVEGEERIDILGETVDTLRVREDIDGEAWRWRATNRWWLSCESRLAWRSIQHLTPDQPPLHIEILKRAA